MVIARGLVDAERLEEIFREVSATSKSLLNCKVLIDLADARIRLALPDIDVLVNSLEHHLLHRNIQIAVVSSTKIDERLSLLSASLCSLGLKVAAFDDRRLERLRHDEGIIRNRLKIYSTRTNAQAVLRLQAEFGSFATYLWNWVDGTTLVNHPQTLADLRPTTELSDRISRDLKRRDFTFVGSTIVYSLLQSVGIVDDHLVGCPFKRR